MPDTKKRKISFSFLTVYTTFWSFFVLNLTSCTKTGVEYTKHTLVLFFPFKLKLKYCSLFSISSVKQSLLFPDIILEYTVITDFLTFYICIRAHCYLCLELYSFHIVLTVAICRYIRVVECYTVAFLFFFSKLDTLLPIRYIFRSKIPKFRQICGKNHSYLKQIFFSENLHIPSFSFKEQSLKIKI